jgi:hypothetical protein
MDALRSVCFRYVCCILAAGLEGSQGKAPGRFSGGGKKIIDIPTRSAIFTQNFGNLKLQQIPEWGGE